MARARVKSRVSPPQTPPAERVFRPTTISNMPPVDRPRRLDSESCNSARKRKRRTPDENTAPTTTRSSLKRRKSLVNGPGDDTDTMDLDSGASVHDGDEYSQSDEHLIHRAAAWQLRRLRKDALVRLYMLASGPSCTPDPSTELTKPELIDALLGARAASSSLPTPSRSPPHTRALSREIKDLPARPRRRTISHPVPVPASLSCDGGDEADGDEAPSSKRMRLAKRRTVGNIETGTPKTQRLTRTRSAQIDTTHPAFASSSDLTEPDSPEPVPRALPSPRRLRSQTSRSDIVPNSPAPAGRRRRPRTKYEYDHHHQLRTPPSDDGDDEAGVTSADDDDDVEASSPNVADVSHVAQIADDTVVLEPEDETVRVLRNGKLEEDGAFFISALFQGSLSPDLDIDLSQATDKSLLRLKRDALLRLCSSRSLPASGTKPQLVQALLGWRDKVEESTGAPSSSMSELSELDEPISPVSTLPMSDASSELSEETVIISPAGSSRKGSKGKPRIPSTKKPNKRRSTPVLERSSRVYVADQPDTPRAPKQGSANGIGGGNPPGMPLGIGSGLTKDELEIDLEELGLEDKEIPADKLVKLEKIGSGGFKDVYIGRLRGRAKVAIAEFRGQLSAMDIKELKLLKDFDHPNVVRFLGVSIPENPRDTPVMMVSELCANGDLFDYIRNVPVPPLRKVISLMLDIARGIKYLHEHKPPVIHRDCKSSNILITNKVTAKIADFGLAKVKQSTRSMVRSLVGTVNWQAPELWHAHPKYDYKVDVYSCGCVFWEMMQWHLPNKKYPWEGMNEHAIYEAVGAKKLRPPTNGLRKQYCAEIVDLVEKMWAQEPKERPTIKRVVEELERLVQIY
ncbi:tyrosine kinase family catalytic domain protein [Rhizoctonia solani 123E]|uniref:Tyrosine kinase family catalytic domain protein n=1 Tax=Rhizoctonia solani 123E TaxID=1423351 RepID=A0A074SVE9_9AGAM|nr:tyrosine kinase family catalytic domain protein [Rhizoctonia solani 123E]